MTRPKPLSRLTDGQSELAGRYHRLALKMASDWAADRPSLFDDLYDAAVDGLLLSAGCFDPAICGYFAHLARLSIWRKMANRMARLRFKRGLLKQVPMLTEPGACDPPFDEFETMIAPLSDREREYIRLRFRDDLSRRAVARSMQIGYGNARGIERGALDELKSRLTTSAPL